MPTEIPDLWADDIKVDVLPPLVILKAQDAAIRRKTQGILGTEVSTIDYPDESHPEDPHHRTTHTLDLVAPALGYRESILEVTHRKGRAYPATLTVPNPMDWNSGEELRSGPLSVTAYTAEELIERLRKALQSRNTKAAIESLLAQSNERRMKTAAPPTNGP